MRSSRSGRDRNSSSVAVFHSSQLSALFQGGFRGMSPPPGRSAAVFGCSHENAVPRGSRTRWITESSMPGSMPRNQPYVGGLELSMIVVRAGVVGDRADRGRRGVLGRSPSSGNAPLFLGAGCSGGSTRRRASSPRRSRGRRRRRQAVERSTQNRVPDRAVRQRLATAAQPVLDDAALPQIPELPDRKCVGQRPEHERQQRAAAPTRSGDEHDPSFSRRAPADLGLSAQHGPRGRSLP